MKVVILGNQSRAVCTFWSVLLRHIQDSGHTAMCWVPEDNSPEEQAALTELRARSSGVRTFFLRRKGLNPFADVRTLSSLYRLCVTEKPDVLFATTIKPVIYGALAAKWAHVPHIYATITGLGYTFERDSFLKRVVHHLAVFLYRRALSQIEGVFFQNPDDAAEFRTDGILTAESRVLYARGTGVDTAHFAKAPVPSTADGVVFLFVGRLLFAKGLEDYVAAARSLVRDFPNARFQILGPKETGLGAIPDELLSSWEECPAITYLGATRDVRPYVAAAHVIVLPSWREGTPTAILEAMSMGRCALVTDVPGCREVVWDGETGFKVRVRDPASLASAMRRLLENPEDIVRMGACAREKAVSLFDADRVAAHILQEMHVL